MSVLQDTIIFIREAEQLVIGQTFKPAGRVAQDLVDALLHVPWFVISGMQGLLYALVRSVLLILVWWLLLYLISLTSKGSAPISTAGLFYGAGVLCAGSILLGLPSTLIARLVREENVSKLANHIVSSGSSTKLLRDGVDRVEAAGQQRVSAIGWGLGLIWALLFWVASNWVLAPNVSTSVRSGAASYWLVGFFVFVVLVVVFTSYREAHRILSQTIAFAFLEAEAIREKGVRDNFR